MPMNLNQFIAEVNSTGVVKRSNFEVYVLRRSNSNTSVERSLVFRCQMADVPGRSIQTVEKKIYGPGYKVAYDTLYSELNMNILLSEDWREKVYFEKWQDLMVGDYASNNSPHSNMFDIGYYDDYIADLEIRSLSDKGQVAWSGKIYEAYPVSVGNVTLDHNAGAEVALLPVSMTFKYLVRT